MILPISSKKTSPSKPRSRDRLFVTAYRLGRHHGLLHAIDKAIGAKMSVGELRHLRRQVERSDWRTLTPALLVVQTDSENESISNG